MIFVASLSSDATKSMHMQRVITHWTQSEGSLSAQVVWNG